MTQSYRVSWEIDVDASSPREAAEKARAIQVKPGSMATVFSVHEHETAEPVQVDLLEDEEDAGAAP